MTEVNEKFHYIEADDKLVIEQVQDVEPILEHNKKLLNEDDGSYKSESFNLVGNIPEVVALKWCRDKGIDYQEFLASPNLIKALLNDPDMSFCKTKRGKV